MSALLLDWLMLKVFIGYLAEPYFCRILKDAQKSITVSPSRGSEIKWAA